MHVTNTSVFVCMYEGFVFIHCKLLELNVCVCVFALSIIIQTVN